MIPLQDAHNHLQDPRLASDLERVVADMQSTGITRCIVNGTSEQDWPAVAALARRFAPLVQPSFGLHPWKAPERSGDWLRSLREHLDEFPEACVGECGLDRWITPHDLPMQQEVFGKQLALAAKHDLPLTIHCLQAWGPLLETLRDHARPARGFLLHSYGGSPEMVRELSELGAWFSFSGHFLHPRKERAREAFRQVPRERLLVETDAPDMAPPELYRPHVLTASGDPPVNHPANLRRIVDGLAEVRAETPAALSAQLSRNFMRFFTIEARSGA